LGASHVLEEEWVGVEEEEEEDEVGEEEVRKPSSLIFALIFALEKTTHAQKRRKTYGCEGQMNNN
jgi:hypothetical protein